ncbi:MAG: DUF4157 domain-containing protein [Bacteroidia bacterium]|nr:DUF4157 domain-containing protein [Bacteroidia bacterium]
MTDHRPEAVTQRKLKELAENSPRQLQLKSLQAKANGSSQVSRVAQFQATANQHTSQPSKLEKDADYGQRKNNTGLPDSLKSGIENLSGMSLDDVKVHRNSDKPAQLQAHAYAQGTDIHLGPGQEKHLPHEAWHVVQQKQGRVRPTLQMSKQSGDTDSSGMGKVNVNSDVGLEKEADVMGEKALGGDFSSKILKNSKVSNISSPYQLVPITDQTNSALLGALGLPLNTNAGLSEALGQFLLGYTSFYYGLISQDAGRFRAAINPYRNSGNYTLTRRALAMYNTFLGVNEAAVPGMRDDADAGQVESFINNTRTFSSEEEGGVRAYVTSQGMLTAINRTNAVLNNMRALGKTWAYTQNNNLISAVTLPMLAVVLVDNGGKASTIKNIPWGQGAETSIGVNQDVHFEKHLLRLNNVANPDEYEPWKWMRLLGYNILKSDINNTGDVYKGIPDIFTDGMIKSRFHSGKFFNEWLPGKNNAIAWLAAQHKNTYLNYAISRTGALQNGIVINTGGEVKVLGNSGETFVAMKVVGGNLTLSSVYIPLDDRVASAMGNAVTWTL